MSTIINKIIDSLIKQKRKIPQAMMIVYVFTILFPSEAIKVIEILNSKIQIVLPKSLKELLVQLQFSQKELLTIWAFLLVIYAFVVIANVLKQILKGQTSIYIDSSSELLFEINSIIFLSLLIYTKLYGFRIEDSIPQFSDFYSFTLGISLLLFIFIFVLLCCIDIIFLCKKIITAFLFKMLKLLELFTNF